MTTFAQYKSLIRVLVLNSFNFQKLNKKGKKSTKILIICLFGLLALVLGAFAVTITLALTHLLGQAGMIRELLYVLVFAAQMIVLFFGSFAVMNYLYYSKDNTLLLSLPLNPKAVFLAKFTMAYLSELLFAALIMLPTLTTVGIVGMSAGYGISWHFFLVEIVAIFFAPVVPLILISLLSVPLVYLISFLKRRAVGNGIVMALMYIAVMAVYFLLIFSSQSLSLAYEEGQMLPEGAIDAFVGIKNATIFNFPLVEAFAGNHTALYTLAYVGGIGVLLAFAIFLAQFFYTRILRVLSEGNAAAPSKKEKEGMAVESATAARAFLTKEWRTLLHTPVLLMNTLMTLILTPLLVFFLSFTMGSAFSGEDVEFAGSSMMILTMVTFMCYIMGASTNMLSLIGFSREGKNLLVLKTLPISAKTLVDAKLVFSTCFTAVTAILVGIVAPFVTKIYSPIAIIGLPLTIFVGGFGQNCLGLRNDLKNPHLRWTNFSELTKNNKRTIKPMLISMGAGFTYMILGMILAFQNSITGEWLYLLYYGIAILPLLVIAFVGYKRLYENPAALLDAVEG